MNKPELHSIAGDLKSERRYILDGLRIIEEKIFTLSNSKELINKIGVFNVETLVQEIARLNGSVDRLGNLANSLFELVSDSRLSMLQTTLESVRSEVLKHAETSKKKICVELKIGDIQIAGSLIPALHKGLCKLAELIVEFCAESARERMARRKSEQIVLQIECSAIQLGFQIEVRIDGNGLCPPLLDEVSSLFSKSGFLLRFEGIPSVSSVFKVQIPRNDWSIMPALITTNSQVFCISQQNILEVRDINNDEEFRSLLKKENIFSITKSGDPKIVTEIYHNTKKYKLLTLQSGMRQRKFLINAYEELRDEAFLRSVGSGFTFQEKIKGLVVVGHEKKMAFLLDPHYLVYLGKS